MDQDLKRAHDNSQSLLSPENQLRASRRKFNENLALHLEQLGAEGRDLGHWANFIPRHYSKHLKLNETQRKVLTKDLPEKGHLPKNAEWPNLAKFTKSRLLPSAVKRSGQRSQTRIKELMAHTTQQGRLVDSVMAQLTSLDSKLSKASADFLQLRPNHSDPSAQLVADQVTAFLKKQITGVLNATLQEIKTVHKLSQFQREKVTKQLTLSSDSHTQSISDMDDLVRAVSNTCKNNNDVRLTSELNRRCRHRGGRGNRFRDSPGDRTGRGRGNYPRGGGRGGRPFQRPSQFFTPSNQQHDNQRDYGDAKQQ